MIACNASIVIAVEAGARAVWHFHDTRTISEVSPALGSWKPWIVVTKAGCRDHVADAASARRIDATFYLATEFVHRRTCAETAIQAAARLGYERVVLLGVDLSVIGGEVYSRRLRFKPCHFQGAELKVFDEMRAGLMALKKILRGIEVVTCSATSPSDLFPRVDFWREIESGA